MTPSPILKLRLSLCAILALSCLSSSIHGQNSKEAISWSGWGGPNGNLSVTKSDFFTDNQNLSLEVAWKRNLGSGYSAVSVLNGIAVTGFSDEESNYLAAYDTETGAEMWRFRMGPVYHGHTASHDGPIATPLITSERVYMLDTYGKLFAVDSSTGKEIWSSDLPSDHEAWVPHYGFSSSPILHGDLVIVLTGGKNGNAIAAFHVDNGEIAWSSTDGTIVHQNPLLWNIGNQTTLLTATNTHLIGLNPKTGDPYFQFEFSGSDNPIGNASTTIVPGSNNDFLFKDSTTTSRLVNISPGEDKWTVEDQWRTRHLKNTYVPAVYFDGHFFGYNTRTLSCVDEGSGQLVWRSREPGDGFPILLDDHLVIATKTGILSMAPASTDGFEEVASLQVFDDIVWAPPSFAGESFYLRSMSELARVDFARTASEPTIGQKLSGVILDSKFNAFIDSLKHSTDKERDIDAFMSAQSRFPIIEENKWVHFIYRGTAEEMAISSPVFGGRTDRQMNLVAGTDLFYYSIELEANARVSYRFTKNFEERVPDSNNPSGLVEMPDWVQLMPDQNIEPENRGRIELFTFHSTLLGKPLTLEVYLPFGYNKSIQYPVVYVNRGDRVIKGGKIDRALDHIIGETVEPLLMVAIPTMRSPASSGGPIESYRQYVGELVDQNSRILIEEVIPAIESRYSARTGPMHRAILGEGIASFICYYATFQYPGIFGKLGIQSITMWESAFEEANLERMRGAEIQPLKIYFEWGKYGGRSPEEGNDFVENSRAFARALTRKGYKFSGGEFNESDDNANRWNHYGLLFETLFPLK